MPQQIDGVPAASPSSPEPPGLGGAPPRGCLLNEGVGRTAAAGARPPQRNADMLRPAGHHQDPRAGGLHLRGGSVVAGLR